MILFAREQQKHKAVNKIKDKEPRKKDQAQEYKRNVPKSDNIEVKAIQDYKARHNLK